MFSLARDWSKRVKWANIPQLKLGNIRGYYMANSVLGKSLGYDWFFLGQDFALG